MVEQSLTQQTSTKVNTDQFNGMAFVGVKKVEYFSRESESIIFDDMTELLENRAYTNNLMLGFFSVNPFGIEKVEKIDSILAMNEDLNEMLVRQGLKKAALFDFADANVSGAGTVHILIVADAIIHWDNDGSYIQPTEDNSVLLDLEDLMRPYPRNYEFIIYSQRDLSSFTARKFEQKPVLEVPVMTGMWYNQPTFQEIYGNIVLTAGLISLALVYGIMNWQQGKIEDISAKIKGLQSNVVNESFYTKSNIQLNQLKEDMAYKNVLSIVIKDISNSVSKSGFKLQKISVEPTETKNVMMVTIESKNNSHTQFSVQEPLAQRILDNSQTIKVLRKKTASGSTFALEALVDLKEVRKETQKLKQNEG